MFHTEGNIFYTFQLIQLESFYSNFSVFSNYLRIAALKVLPNKELLQKEREGSMVREWLIPTLYYYGSPSN